MFRNNSGRRSQQTGNPPADLSSRRGEGFGQALGRTRPAPGPGGYRVRERSGQAASCSVLWAHVTMARAPQRLAVRRHLVGVRGSCRPSRHGDFGLAWFRWPHASTRVGRTRRVWLDRHGFGRDMRPSAAAEGRRSSTATLNQKRVNPCPLCADRVATAVQSRQQRTRPDPMPLSLRRPLTVISLNKGHYP